MRKTVLHNGDVQADIWAFWGHEPIQFYRRRNSDQNSIFASGEWIPAWYERLHSEEGLSRLAELGANLISVHFYKSFGLAFERSEMLRTRELAKIAHRYGIRVLGYLTLNYIYAESLSDEIPELKNYFRQDKRGNVSDSSRVRLCLNSDYYCNYLCRVIEYGWQEVGLDGFHFDNVISGGDADCAACYCPRCTKGFRQFLESRLDPLHVGLPNFRHVEIPRLPPASHPDPIELEALHYVRTVYDQKYGALFRYAKQVSNEDAMVLVNCGFADPTLTPAEVGHEIAAARDVDYIFVETPDDFIRRTPAKLKSAVLAYKLAGMANVKAINTMWLKLDQGVYPNTSASVKRVIAEAMIYDAVPGSNWAARPIRDGDRMIFDDPAQFSLLQQYFHFYQQNQQYYHNTLNINHIKLFYSSDARLSGGVHYEKVLHLTAEALTASAVPYSLLLSSDAVAADNLILVPDAATLGDLEVKRLYEYVRQNKASLLFLGKGGVYRADGMQREKKPFTEFECLEIPENLDDSAQVMDFQQWLVSRLPRKIELSPAGLMLETVVNQTGEKVYHLLNPDNEKVLNNVRLYDPDCDFTGCRMISPAGTPDFEARGSCMHIRSFDTMCSIIVKGK